MTLEPLCPRCGAPVERPGMMSSEWRCGRHGPVAPLRGVSHLNHDVLKQIVGESGVPMWFPWPLPNGWVITGTVLVGDDRFPSVAAAMLCTGPAARSGPGELVFVSENPGIGLGAGYAALPGPDAGADVFSGTPTTRVLVGHHETPLWEIPGPSDRSIYVGEAQGRWLWAVAWPMEVGLVLHDDLTLLDLRDPGLTLDPPIGALSPRWRPGHLVAGAPE